MKKIIKEDNFFLNTFGVFKKIKKNKITDREPDYISYCKLYGSISSKYWYTHKGVYRLSDHWESVASCAWVLEDKGKMVTNNIKRLASGVYGLDTHLGYCLWEDFLEIKEYFTGHRGKIPIKERNEHTELYPKLPKKLIGKNILIYEFRSLLIDEVENSTTPIFGHPNHYSDYVKIIESSDMKKIYKLLGYFYEDK